MRHVFSAVLGVGLFDWFFIATVIQRALSSQRKRVVQHQPSHSRR